MRGCGVRYLVDGMNVIGSRPDGWWRDRPAARRRLVERLSKLVADAEVTVVFDGRPSAGEEQMAGALGVAVRFAPGGPDAADDDIAEAARHDDDPASLVVVTSDSTLASRVVAAGAHVMSVKRFASTVDD